MYSFLLLSADVSKFQMVHDTVLEIGYTPSDHNLYMNYESIFFFFSFLAHNFNFIVTDRLKIANSSASNHSFCMQIYLLQHHSFWYRKFVFLRLIKNTFTFSRDVFLTKSLLLTWKSLFLCQKVWFRADA